MRGISGYLEMIFDIVQTGLPNSNEQFEVNVDENTSVADIVKSLAMKIFAYNYNEISCPRWVNSEKFTEDTVHEYITNIKFALNEGESTVVFDFCLLPLIPNCINCDDLAAFFDSGNRLSVNISNLHLFSTTSRLATLNFLP